MTSERNKRIYLSSRTFRISGNMRGKFSEKRGLDGNTWIYGDCTEDDFGEPIIWSHRDKNGGIVDFVTRPFGKWNLFDDDRVLNMSIQDAIRVNSNRITMSMDDMLDMMQESEENKTDGVT